ncbi:hypothetical protein DPMN_007253 [Dreissena polymorpha]|uniref:Homeobox domain-containing protein n=1 Tax=Dreissena polymorpha TaxID=45954 RepID=A0A9D4MX14_DREPO|nr:hypothetical protein DPMN_007253 [Dreissena polymorpha]
MEQSIKCTTANASERKEQNRRELTTFTREQLRVLESIFSNTKYPETEIRDLLSTKLDLTKDHILIWFKNRRAITRNQQKKKIGSTRPYFAKETYNKHKTIPTVDIVALATYCVLPSSHVLMKRNTGFIYTFNTHDVSSLYCDEPAYLNVDYITDVSTRLR